MSVQGLGAGQIVDVAAGIGHSLALTSNGTVWAWGINVDGELGDGTRTTSPNPVQIPNFTNVTSVAAGVMHSVALKSDGTVWTWGDNTWGELGSGSDNVTLPSSTVPLAVRNLDHSIGLGKGVGYHGLAIVSANTNTNTPFASADARLTITAGPPSSFSLNESVTLGATSNGIDPLTEAVMLQIGTYTVTIPANSFRLLPNGRYAFAGVIDGVSLSVQLHPLSSNSFAFKVSGSGGKLSSLTNPVTVVLTIGDDSGTTMTTAKFN